MQDSDDLDDFDDIDVTELIEAATQAEARFAHDEFDHSPQPTKRRRVHQRQLDGDDSEDEIENGIHGSRTPLNINNAKKNAPLPHGSAAGGSGSTSIFSKGLNKRALPVGTPGENYLDNDENADSKKRSSGKPKRRVHISNQPLNLNGVYMTQHPNSSNPWQLRGPIWHKNPPQIVPNSHTEESAQKQTPDILHGATSLDKGHPQLTTAATRAASTPFDVAEELADLPSDAFSSSSPAEAPKGLQTRVAPPMNGLRQTTLFGRDVADVPASQANKRRNWPMTNKSEPPAHHKLDLDTMKTWVYPTNLGSIRDYQFNIVARGLFHNLLVALPTGLGKTFIAATIMLNWYRWTKEAQIVFVAPTKPLVAQQVEACFGIAGIPRSQTTMLTGEVAPALRGEEWINKRVFFMTPHTLINDLKTGICDPKRIVLIVVDEAHRATGNHANVEVVRFVRRFNENFRVLALTATPGSDVESVQKVIDALDISRVEIRTEQSLDIRHYVHQRQVDTELFDISEEMEHVMDLFTKAVQPVLNVLCSQNAYWIKDPCSLTPFGLTKARQQWMASEAGRRVPQGLKGMINSVFTVLASLAHGVELLKYHGIGPFYHNMIRFRTETQTSHKSKYRKQINENENFVKMMNTTKMWINSPDFVGHPKLEFLRDAVLAHFTHASERGSEIGPSSTRIMIFAHFRDSAEMIVRVLGRLGDMVRAHVFVGQATSKESEGMDQKKQLEVIQKFKNGVYNTLVATSIGEEGLDIGEVDLIICYDSKASPIRMLQRMGRTGRKRSGKIVLLQMKGKEEQDALKAKDTYEKMQSMIAAGDHFNFHDDRSRRIVPKDIQPAVDKREVDIPWENTQAADGDSFLPVPTGRRKKLKRPPKKFHMPDGVNTGFTTAARLNGNASDSDELPTKRKRVDKLAGVIELQPIPNLAEVCLTEAQEEELNRQYLTINDEADDLFITKPSLTSHPREQRVLRGTKFVRHGQRTIAMVRMIQRMRHIEREGVQSLEEHVHMSDLEGDKKTDNDLTESTLRSDSEGDMSSLPYPLHEPKTASKPIRISDVNTDALGGESASEPDIISMPVPRRGKQPAKRKIGNADYDMDAQDAAESSPPPSSARWKLPSQAVTLGSDTSGSEVEDDEEPDSELARFVVDDDEALELATSSQESQLSLGVDTYFEHVQEMKSTQNDEDDLPEVGTLVARAASKRKDANDTSKQPTTGGEIQRRKRRVVDDSSSE